MQAAMFYAPQDARIEETAHPQPAAGEIVVGIEVALTCGTDLKCYQRGHPVLLASLPSLFGHEFCGIVSAVGEGVSSLTIGDRVVAANSAPCGSCFYCANEQFTLCENLHLLNGAYAQFLKIPAPIVAKNTIKIPTTCPPERAAFLEPVAVCLRAVRKLRVAFNGSLPKHVAILGIGPIGLILGKLLTMSGVEVTGFGRNPKKIMLAHTFSKIQNLVPLPSETEHFANWAKDIKTNYTPEGRGFDAVIEAAGQPFLWQASQWLARKGGLLNFFGGCPAATTVGLDTFRLHYEEVRVQSLFHHTPQDVAEAARLLGSGALEPQCLITHQLPLNDLKRAFELMQRGEALKVAIRP
ncbi:MAG: alcohol dehydrogenase catalytic domain-containing protein [Vampirovibrionales bacterium]|nr:alcohol dehydrogenase catalytic domain-containing protein [Vampirovibrionales bacterium]